MSPSQQRTVHSGTAPTGDENLLRIAASGDASKLLSGLQLNSVRTFFAGADTNEALNCRDPDLSIADFAGVC